MLVERLKERIRVAPGDLRENGEDLVTEVPGLFQIEQSGHFSAVGCSSFDLQIQRVEPLIHPTLYF
jgi:hypothetical protein